MGRALFISDLHIGSERILKLCRRPFATLEEQDEAIVSNWRKAVNGDDTVYLLGDLAEGDYERTIRILLPLPGHKILVIGNHDDEQSLFHYQRCNLFDRTTHYAKIESDGEEIILSHYPIMDWEDRQYGSIQIYGHIHNKDLPEIREYYKDKPCYNCGADVICFTPRTVEELKRIKEAQS